MYFSPELHRSYIRIRAFYSTMSHIKWNYIFKLPMFTILQCYNNISGNKNLIMINMLNSIITLIIGRYNNAIMCAHIIIMRASQKADSTYRHSSKNNKQYIFWRVFKFKNNIIEIILHKIVTNTPNNIILIKQHIYRPGWWQIVFFFLIIFPTIYSNDAQRSG